MKLSCIVPTLNEEDNVKGFLEGYSIQTEKFHELIFVDGNSKDKTIEVIKQYQKKFPEIKIIICDRKGPAAARNEGLANATGEYITFMDADWKFLDKNVITRITRLNLKEVLFIHIYNHKKIEYNGIRKYIYLKDKGVAFAIIKKEKCPKFDEELGFGEDRIFYDIELKKLNTKKNIFSDNEIAMSRAEGNMNLDKLLKRYKWYGRTIPKYLKKSIDWKYGIGYVIYVISIIPLFWFIPFLRGFIRGLKDLKYGLDVPFGLGFVEILTAIGISLGFIQWVVGIKEIGRDVQ